MLLAIYRYISRHLTAYMNVSCMFYNSFTGYLQSSKEKLLPHPIYMCLVFCLTVCTLSSSTKCYSRATELMW